MLNSQQRAASVAVASTIGGVAHALASSSDAAAQLVSSLAVGIGDLLPEGGRAFGAAQLL